MGKIVYSKTPITSKTRPSGLIILRILESLGLVEVHRDPKSGIMTECSNLTIINLILVYSGPMREDAVARRVMLIQVLGSLFAFVFRYLLVYVVRLNYDGQE